MSFWPWKKSKTQDREPVTAPPPSPAHTAAAAAAAAAPRVLHDAPTPGWTTDGRQERYKRWAEMYRQGESLTSIAKKEGMSPPGIRYGLTAYYGVSSIQQVKELLGDTASAVAKPGKPVKALSALTKERRVQAMQEVKARLAATKTWGERKALFQRYGGGSAQDSILTVRDLATLFQVSDASVSLWRKAIREGRFNVQDTARMPKNTALLHTAKPVEPTEPNTPVQVAETVARPRWAAAEHQAAEQQIRERMQAVHSYIDLRRLFQEVAGEAFEASPLTGEELRQLLGIGHRTFYKWRATLRDGTFRVDAPLPRYNKLARKYQQTVSTVAPTPAVAHPSPAARAAERALAELAEANLRYKEAMEQVARRGYLWEQPLFQRRVTNMGSVIAQTTAWLIDVIGERQTRRERGEDDNNAEDEG